MPRGGVAVGGGEAGVMGRAPVTRDGLLTCQGMAERVPAGEKDYTKGGSRDAVLSFGRSSWMTDKNLLRRKGWARLKGLTAFILTGWLISCYSSRIGLSEGNSGKYLILSDIDYLERSFCINPNTSSCFVLKWHGGSFLISWWRFFRVSALLRLLSSKPGPKS